MATTAAVWPILSLRDAPAAVELLETAFGFERAAVYTRDHDRDRLNARTSMGIRRAVPDLTSADLDRSRAFYGDFLGFAVGMDMGWVVAFVSPDNPTAQVIVMDADRTADVQPDMSIEVDDVDRVHATAVELGHEVVHPLTDEPWGVRRFFVRDPDGMIVNVLSHVT